MADVDLSVEVRNGGVEAAIKNIRQLKADSEQTAQGMTQLAQSVNRAMENVTKATADSTKTVGQYRKGIVATGKDATSLAAGLSRLESEYRKLSKLAPAADAAQRLTISGNGSLAAGIANARTIQQTREAFNADPVRDMNTVIAQQNALLAERARILAENAARQEAMNSRTTAQSNLARAQYDAANKGMTDVERATLAVTRAQKDYQRSVQASADASANLSRRSTPAQIQAQTVAWNQQAAALRTLTAAERELGDAKQGVHRGDSNAFQGSFSYFIIAGMATQASRAILGVGEAAVTASAEIERSFADVDRTFDGTQGQLASLKARLFELSTTTPNSFVDLSQIAALGNQLGIAAQDIEGFTTTIAQYSAVSGQSAEDSATAFGKISNLTGLAASQYSNLASAIEYTARTTVSTEATISRTSTEITALASGAGFSAQAIVGLAGALSSLSIPPERARGALSLYFGALNSAVAEGGPKLAAFAQLTGKTTDEIGKLVQQNRGQEVFTSFISGLSQLNTVAKTTALDTLGLSTIRVDQTMRALSQNVPLVTSALAGSDAAFKANTEIGRQYAVIQAQLSTKITEFQNAIQNAAAAAGSSLAPALSDLLAFAVDLVTQFSAFAATPYGRTLLAMAGAVAALVAAIAALVGVLALARAGLVVFRFALSGLDLDTAATGFKGLIASMLSADTATRKAAFSMTGLRVAMAETSGSAIALRVASGLLKATLIGLALGTVVAAFSAVDQSVNATKYAMEGLGASSDDLAAAMRSDNAELFAAQVSKAGDASGTAKSGVDGLNGSVLDAIKTQQDAASSVGKTNTQLDAQALKAGKATQEWIKNAVLQSEALKRITAPGEDDGGIWGFLTNKTGQDKQLQTNLQTALSNGFDLSKFSKIAYAKGNDAALAYYNSWKGALIKKASSGDSAAKEALKGILGTADLGSEILEPISKGLEGAKVKALIGTALEGADAGLDKTTAATDSLGNALTSTGQAAVATGDGFYGATSSLTEYQDAIQSGLGKFSDFSTILGKVKDAQDAVNNNPKRGGKDGTATNLINASAFNKELSDANTAATNFFTGIDTLAKNGRSSFATQLASLGPDAQLILSSALNLSPEAQADLEANARFAAFLASDAFKKTFETSMADTSEAYARILQGGGTLSDVRNYIAAQVAGGNAAKAWELGWDQAHPDAPLVVDIQAPDDASLDILGKQLSNKITVAPKFDLSKSGQPRSLGNTYTDTTTGNTITLPASLDGAALDASLAIWNANQKAKPQDIASALNTQTLNTDLAEWIKVHGKIQLNATVKITPPPATLPGFYKLPGGVQANQARGGMIETPHFASGGSWGQFRGPGTGTSDSILARVSANEYINTADSTKFWGADFFDSLNRKMLPTSFVNMLGAAARGGSNGPTHVAHVNVQQINPLTRDPLKQLREESEMVAAGIWG